MITTDFTPGAPCWLELGTPDVDAAAAFYRRMFGWTDTSAGPHTGGYRFARLDGKDVGGLGPLMEEGEQPAWTAYFSVPDAGAAAKAVRGLGGTVLVEPLDVMGLGWMAHFLDPRGGHFAVWQEGRFAGFDVADRPGTLCWLELWSPDGAGARSFYGGLFGWSFHSFALAGAHEYTLVGPEGTGEEAAHGGILPVDRSRLSDDAGTALWIPVFRVDDCDAAAERAADAGGQVYTEPEDTPGVGRVANCADPFGAGFMVLGPSV
ncbi:MULTISPECIES: VOC family protein [Nocardiopsidaceae]|uniref:VOC family protein n=2 Tax=Nocardiopsidaceae TaxID=83676 RepID=A0ABY6YPK4_9ACTN|nr:VOC family protein [Streptomonospora nanhaiensis]MEE2044706.1 VOC family protein [Nocardiopsis tropica]WAE73730.1 VOC family protein [Streptomonospora nanhaiensis]